MTFITERGPADGANFDLAASRAWSNERLELVLFPTEQCNFRCTYCYEDFAIGRMRRAVVEGVKALVERRAPELRQLHVLWFGGEPLAAFDLMAELAEHFWSLGLEHGFQPTGDVTTNGYLLDLPKLEALCKTGTRTFQISLDGPAEMHNSTRRRANGGASFVRIWQNLEAARGTDLDFHVLLRVHLTARNAAAMPSLVETLRDEFLNDPRFSVFFMPVARLGGPGDADLPVLEADEAAALIRQLQRLLAPGRTETAASPERSQLNAPVDVCYASKSNSLVIRANGSVGKCTVALASDKNRIGRINANGDLDIDAGKVLPWLSGWQMGSRGQLMCPLNSVPELRE